MEKELSPNERLDAVLWCIEGSKTPLKEQEILDRLKTHSNIQVVNHKFDFEMVEILQKLLGDKFIKFEEDVSGHHATYIITFEGRVFINDKGYVEKQKREETKEYNKRIRNVILTVGTAAAGAYGIFEILNTVFPHLFHH